MADRKNHITNSKDYQRYLDDQMTPKERHDFEMQLLNDDFESEALEGLAQQNIAEFNEDMGSLKSRLNKRTKKKSHYYWRIAAALLLLGVFSFVVYYTLDFNPTNQVTQSKKAPATKKTEILDKTVIADSANEPGIIAYQQKFKKEEKAEKPIHKIIEPQEPLLVEEEAERNVMADAVEEMDNDVGVETAPSEASELAYEQETGVDEVEYEEEKVADAMPRAEVLAAAPVTINKIESTSARKQKASGFTNTKTITGSITSTEDDEGVPGVNVIIKGSSIGTVTDMEGNFSINIPVESEETLVIASVGYMSEEVTVGDQSQIDIAMEPDITSLSEIVVVAYGTSSDHEKPEYSFIPPKPEGGNGNFKDYIKENIRYPESGIEEKTKGTVKLKFTVGTNGQISDMEVLKSLGEEFDQEAIRLLEEGPDWEPAKENDSSVARDVKVKIRFRAPE